MEGFWEKQKFCVREIKEFEKKELNFKKLLEDSEWNYEKLKERTTEKDNLI